MELTCRWRGPQNAHKRYSCSSPKLVSSHGVSLTTCEMCYCRNHAPLPLWKRFTAAARDKWRLLSVFVRALLRHVTAGLPQASPADVAARRAICNPCCWRDKEKDVCTKCGCTLGSEKHLVAKLVWAKERCPMWDPEKRPGEYWGSVRGESIFRRLFGMIGLTRY